MSPSNFSATGGNAVEWSLYSAGYLDYGWIVTSSVGARPVINLKSDVKITGGTGTANDPFVIDTNN